MTSGIHLPIRVAGIDLHNPVVAASGCTGAGPEFARFADLAGLGAVVTRSVTLDPRAGRPWPRVVESPGGLVNAVGLPGPGMEAFIDRELPWLLAHSSALIVSIAADTVADYGRLASQLRHIPGLAGVEVNLSSPVVDAGVLPFSTDASGSGAVVHAVRRNTAVDVPVFAKLSGDVADVVPVAKACVDAGAEGLSLINAVRGLTVDVNTGRPALGARIGGLSGPAIRPIALKAVWDAHRALPGLPIIGGGGIADGESALAMILAGASAVSVGTALVQDPRAGERIVGELQALLAARGWSLDAAVGRAHQVGDRD